MDNFACDGSNNERMFRSREEDDSFTENQLIGFHQQGVCKWLLYLLICTLATKHVQFASMNEWKILICYEQQTHCSEIWIYFFEKNKTILIQELSQSEREKL